LKSLTSSSSSLFLGVQLINPAAIRPGLKITWLKILVPVFILAGYLLTLSPTVGLIDCGELTTGCYLLDILHPTGYPLYTLIGNILSKIPIGNIAQRINFVSAIYCAIAGFFFFILLLDLTNSAVAALVGTSLFAFSQTIWSVGVGAEVYGLTALFIVLIIYLWTRYHQNNIIIFLAFILGMGFTNHMMIASTFIASAVFLSLTFKHRLSLRFFIILAIFFLLGLSAYFYLPIRAQTNPLFNWGNPYNLERFIWHVTGKQYRVWMFSSSWSAIATNIKSGLKLLLSENFYIFIIPAIWGLWKFYQTRKHLAVSLLIILLLTFGYAINYSIPDIESYYIPCLTVLFLLGGIGISLIMKKVKVPQFFWLILIFLPILANYRRAGMQGNYIAYDSAVNHLKSVPENATIITDWWDFYSPAFYLQHIEDYRSDVCIIDKELLRRSWYYLYLKKQYPWLYQNSNTEINHFREFLDQFEHGRLKDVVDIQDAYIQMLNSFIDHNPARRTFVTFDDRTDFDAKSIEPARKRIPYGLLYELTNDTVSERFNYEQLTARKPNLILDDRTKMVLKRYEAFGLARAVFLQKQGRKEEALQTLDWVLKVNPGSSNAQNFKKLLNQ
jgi:tetratricopeptide (TPR) repeat protein